MKDFQKQRRCKKLIEENQIYLNIQLNIYLPHSRIVTIIIKCTNIQFILQEMLLFQSFLKLHVKRF